MDLGWKAILARGLQASNDGCWLHVVVVFVGCKHIVLDGCEM